MEEPCEDLQVKAEDVSVPPWHKDLLDERERLIENGKAQFSDWETAKNRITKLTS
jgi:hypothetical protein